MAAEPRLCTVPLPQESVMSLALRPTRLHLAFCASGLLLAGCAGAPSEPAMMLRSSEGGAMMPVAAAMTARPVEFVAVTAANIDAFSLPPTTGDEYALGIGDRVQLHVIDAPELSNPANGYLVEGDGAVQLPFLGRVPMNGLSTTAIRADLVRRLSPYLPEPQVEVRVTEFNARHVAVVGAVPQPRRQVLTDRPLTVIDAINEAGGFVDGAENASVVLIRGGVESRVDITAFLTAGQDTPVLRDGDVLRIGGRGAGPRGSLQPQVASVQVQTADGRVQAVALGDQPVSLAQLLNSLPMQGTRAYVLRGQGARIQGLHLGAAEALAPALGGRLMLHPGDAVALVTLASDDPNAALAVLTPALRALNPL